MHLDRMFTISAGITIVACLAGAVMSVATGEWGVLPWQLTAAAWPATALIQAKRANRAEAGR
ncbi:hypothetical protein [Nocardiopsis alba]|uniref:hypothetical protein n=1 Tax=Nocardiopsis alba TaxID=53437 RepID=UPI003D73F88C